MPKIYFCRRDWEQDCVPMKFYDFPNITLFPNNMKNIVISPNFDTRKLGEIMVFFIV